MKKTIMGLVALLSIMAVRVSLGAPIEYDCFIQTNSKVSPTFPVSSDKPTTYDFDGYELYAQFDPICPGLRLTHLSSGISAQAEVGTILKHLLVHLDFTGSDGAVAVCEPKTGVEQ